MSVIHRGSGLLALVLAGCDGVDTEASPADIASPDSVHARTYSGPGSFWSATFSEDEGTFHIEMSDNVGEPIIMVLEGSFEEHNGWKVLTIESATDIDGAPEVGSKAIGIEVPGFAFMMRPVDAEHNSVIPMLVQDDCPQEDETLNWMVAQGFSIQDASSTASDFFGTYSYDYIEHTVELGTSYALEGHTALDDGGQVMTPDACSGGVMTFSMDGAPVEGLPPINLWMVPGGGIVEIFHPSMDGSSVEKQTIFALHAEELSLSDLAGSTFIGMHFSAPTAADLEQAEAGEIAIGQIREIEVLFDDSGVGSGAEIADVESGIYGDSAGELVVEQLNYPGNGFFTATLNEDDFSGRVSCSMATGMGEAGQSMISCIGQDPSDNSSAFTMVLASQ